MNPTELDIVFEEIPAQAPRPPGKGREPTKWEDHLAPMKEHVGQSARVWTYPEKSSATSRLGGVSKRLADVTPADNWTLKVRPVPDSDPPLFGVYVVYNGIYTAEQVKANADLRVQRSEAAKARIAAAGNGTGTTATDGGTPEDAVSPPTAKSTAAQKVAAAKAAKGK